MSTHKQLSLYANLEFTQSENPNCAQNLFEEFCVRKYAAARSKTISQLEAGSEFTERHDTGSGAQVRP